MDYQAKYKEIGNKYLVYYENYIKELREDIEVIEKRYKEDQQKEMISSKTEIFSYNVKNLQSEYEQEVNKLIEMVEKEKSEEELEKDLDNDEREKKEENLNKEDRLILLMTKNNELLEKSIKQTMVLERTKIFDEDYIIELLEEESLKEDKEIYNLVVSKVKGMEEEYTEKIKMTINQLNDNTPEKIFQRFKGNFEYIKSGGQGLPSFSNQKLNNLIYELNNPYYEGKNQQDNTYFKN